MKKFWKTTLVGALALLTLSGCAAAPADSAESLFTAYSPAGTVLTAALSAPAPEASRLRP